MKRTQIRAQLHAVCVRYPHDLGCHPTHGISFLDGVSFHDSKEEAMIALNEEMEHLVWEHIDTLMNEHGIGLQEAMKLSEDIQEIEEYLTYTKTSAPKIDLPDGVERWLPECEALIGYTTC
mgnify:FL=1